MWRMDARENLQLHMCNLDESKYLKKTRHEKHSRIKKKLTTKSTKVFFKSVGYVEKK